MVTPDRAAALGYGVIIAGVLLAFASAVVPFYDAGYKLDLGVLAAGMLPYLLYVLPVVFVRGLLTIVAGMIVIAVHAWLVVRERFFDNAGYGDGLIYFIPLVLAALLVPLVVIALRRPWHK